MVLLDFGFRRVFIYFFIFYISGIITLEEYLSDPYFEFDLDEVQDRKKYVIFPHVVHLVQSANAK